MFYEDIAKKIHIKKVKRSFCYPEHVHRNIEVMICLEGRIEVVCNEKTKLLLPGDFVIAFQNDVHSYPEVRDAGLILLFFDPDVSDIMKTRLNKHKFENFGSCKEAIPLLNAFYEEYSHNGDYLVLYGYLHAVMGMLFRNLATVEDAHDISPDLVSKALKYISQNYTSPLTLKSTAKRLGVDPCHLSREISKKIPVGFCGYIHQLRIEKAKKLLTETNHSIYDIMLETGFSNQQTFYRVFKQFTETTPRQYRASSR